MASLIVRASVLAGMVALAGCATSILPSTSTSRLVSAAEDPVNGPCIQTSHGCLALNPDVTAATISQTICVSGYTRSVRPASSFTRGIKNKLLRESGIDESRAGEFELDHRVPLELGGHPRKLSNLALQPWDGPAGATRKDGLENRLHALVCQGAVALLSAQECIASDWQACNAKYPPR